MLATSIALVCAFVLGLALRPVLDALLAWSALESGVSRPVKLTSERRSDFCRRASAERQD